MFMRVRPCNLILLGVLSAGQPIGLPGEDTNKWIFPQMMQAQNDDCSCILMEKLLDEKNIGYSLNPLSFVVSLKLITKKDNGFRTYQRYYQATGWLV